MPINFNIEQKVWCIWKDAFKGFIPRELKVIGVTDKLKDGTNLYHLISKTNVDVYTTEHRLFSTQAEAQAECDRRNNGK